MSKDGLTWIKHAGGPMPVPGDTIVTWDIDPSFYDFNHRKLAESLSWDIITRYAIVTPSPSAANDPVEQPSHYKQGGIECIEAIRAALTPDEFRGYCKGNMLKYAWRERHKNGDEDLRKAAVYAGFATDKPNG